MIGNAIIINTVYYFTLSTFLKFVGGDDGA